MSNDPLDDLFAGSGAPAVKFANLGDSVTGVITGLETRQQTDFDSGEPLTWDDGKPRMELIITLATKLRDPEIEDDEGERRVFCRGAMLTAFKQAVRKVWETKPAIGGRVTITHDAEGEAKKKGFNPPKLYSVEYEAPGDVAVEGMFAEPEQATLSTEELLAKARDMDPAELAALIASGTK